MLTLEDCLTILEQINGLVVVDDQARIVFINRRVAEMMGIEPEDVIGKYIQDVISSTKVHKTVETREPSIADFYFVRESTIVSSRFPLYRKSKFIGAIEYDLFEDYKQLKNFLKKAESLPNELSFFKQEAKRMQGNRYSIEQIVGESPQINKLRKEIAAAARTNSTVLITGESGSGKELVAHSIHALSERSREIFVPLNCSAIPFELFESELFGFEEGTFTNARKGGQTGKFQLANGGTLFLDEINQMPLELQPKILRALQEKEIDKIGSKYSIPINVRVICATNQDLKELVKKGKFREDLYYRLNVIHIRVPPLREHKEDIPLLVNACIDNLNHLLSRNVKTVSPEVLAMLKAYDWPGNVRELQNTLERMVNGIDQHVDTLEVSHFENFIEENLSVNKPFLLPPTKGKPLDEIRDRAEREAILQVLELCGGNKSEAAKMLQIPRPLLYQKMKRLNIEVGKSEKPLNQ